VKVGHSTGRPGWIALLAVALLLTSLQAKLGLYHPEQSQARLVSKAFKLSECRLDRAVPDSPVVVAAAAAMAVERRDEPHGERNFFEYVPAEPRSVFLSRSHWFRPPPARS
jgi:hypothetical protein